MIELLRQMILSVTAASLFGAVVLAMVPDGAMKEVLRMGTGLLLIVSLVLPLQRYTPHAIGDFLPRLERQTARSQDTTDLIRQEILREVEVEAAPEHRADGTEPAAFLQSAGDGADSRGQSSRHSARLPAAGSTDR